MVLYVLSLYVLVEHIRIEFPGFLQSCYADDFITVGKGANLLPAISYIEELVPAHCFCLDYEIKICTGLGVDGGRGMVGNGPTAISPERRGATSGGICSINRGSMELGVG